MAKRKELVCAKKRSYPTFSRADQAANNVAVVFGQMLKVYKCENCGEYHLTKRRNYDYYQRLQNV